MTRKRSTGEDQVASGIPDIQAKVNWCMEHLAGPDGEDPTYPGFAAYASAHGLPGTEGSLRQLDTGYRTSPGAGILDAISAYFAIPINFWTDDVVRAAVMKNDVGHRGHTMAMIQRLLSLPSSELDRLLGDD